MKKLALIFLVVPYVLLAQDQKAKDILNKLSEKTRSYSSIEAHFTNTFSNSATKINEKQKGILYLKGDAFRLELEGQSVLSDGETNWIFLKDEEELNISEQEEGEDELSPTKIFTLYEEGYKYKFVSEDSKNYHVDLFPIESGAFSKVELFINKTKMQISSFTMIDKQGSKYDYYIDSFFVNKKFEDDFFIFNVEDYPNIDIIDLR